MLTTGVKKLLRVKDIHTWFGLSYARYLVIPRSVLQSMPNEWQEQFVGLLNELDEKNWVHMLPKKTNYKVELRSYDYNDNDRFVWRNKVNDPLMDYNRGRRNVFGSNCLPQATESTELPSETAAEKGEL